MSIDDRPTKPRGLAVATFSGLRWSYVSTATVAIVQLLYVSVMSRLLSPEAFGIYAIAMLTVAVGDLFAQMGLHQAIVQRTSISRDDIRASATAGVVTGFALFALLWIVAPFISAFFDEPAATPVLRVMGANFVFVGLGVTSQGVLRRELRFRTLSIAQIAAYLVGYGLVGIGLAVAGAGVWSLAAAVIAVHVVATAIQYASVRHPLRPILRVRRFKALYSFGARTSVIGIVEFLGRQLDTFAVGRYAATSLLGQYNRAFVLVNMPLSQQVSGAIMTVVFPAFSKIQHDVPRLVRTYLGVMALGGMLIFPVSAGMAAASRELVLVVLGNQWDVARQLVPYFAVAVSLNIMTKFSRLLCQAKAELNSVIWIQVIYLVLLAAGYVAVSGLEDVRAFAAVLAVGEAVRHVALGVMVRKVIGVRLRDTLQAYAPAFVAAVVVAVSVGVTSRLAQYEALPTAVLLILEMAIAALALAASIRLNPFSWVRTELGAGFRAAGLLEDPRRASARIVRALVGRRSTMPPASRTL